MYERNNTETGEDPHPLETNGKQHDFNLLQSVLLRPKAFAQGCVFPIALSCYVTAWKPERNLIS